MDNNVNDKPLETDDFESQKQIIEDERLQVSKYKKNIVLSCIFLLVIILIIVMAYVTLYAYRLYGGGQINPGKMCKYVNQKINGSKVPNLNVSKDDKCIPFYNVDYYQNQKPTFNIDIFGNKTRLFNQINQLDENGMCKLNCDSNNDGWPDYNIDLTGDGVADLNIIFDYNKKKTCDLNCDINKDGVADTNIDVDNDNKPDINITDDDYTKPKYNIDYKGNRKPTFNVKDKDGNITNPINQLDNDGKCTKNCDLDNDGWPDYNIDIIGDGTILNELIDSDDSSEIDYKNSKYNDWKCYIKNDCNYDKKTPKNTYINIDVDGDGKADINVSNDGGKTITNPINNEVVIDGKTIILNEDIDGDGFPDLNIDINGDGKPDLNIGKDGKCTKNCDTNNDGKADYLIDINDKNINVNIDTDYDGYCDVNCDIDHDLYPDLNIDVNDDNVPDLNIDFDKDGKPDFNIDIDGDGKPDLNVDIYGLGKCNFNCVNDNGQIDNPIGSGDNCTKNCDTTGDGLPNLNVDIDGDGICDFNCNNGTTNIDSDNNYYEDDKYKNEKNILEIAKGKDSNLYVYNPLEILSIDIEPGWNDTYVLKIQNNTNYAVAYKLIWKNVYNDFTDINNLDYFITRSNISYLNNLKAPRQNINLSNEVLIKENTTVKYVLNISWKETGINQNIDSGKTFKGQLYIETIH